MTITAEAINILISTAAIIIATVTAISSQKISRENTRLTNATVELEMRNLISDARRHLADVFVKLTPYLDNQSDLNDSDKTLFDAVKKQYEDAKQDYINCYEELCMKYIDGKIDKERFKKNYIIELRKLVTNDDLKNNFDSLSSPYTAIKKVYDEWENHEK